MKYGLWDKVMCWFDTGQPPPKKKWELYITNTIANFEYGVWRATCLLYPSTSMFVKVCPNIGLCIWRQISDHNGSVKLAVDSYSYWGNAMIGMYRGKRKVVLLYS